MLDIIEFIGEVGSSFPYLYRAWGFILLPSYRKRVLHEYKAKSKAWVAFDTLMSLLFFVLELWLVAFVLDSVF
ncbi:hypothetical protein [Microbulbifer hainanensis]|uniref:hypothetical protein n=1 Tax=Microbulbifer hainanensis TaxID=2735675 RepID=UPI0018679FAF|nr:hypothetical protein [Microbulbifer hainanensis]